MKIESIEVIPMTNESKWEDIPKKFDVSFITTDYVKWFVNMMDERIDYPANSDFSGECRIFAKAQKAFMLAPTAMFGDKVYLAKSRIADSLEGLVLDGPLYRINVEKVPDKTAEKNTFRTYIDPDTFVLSEGLWYPDKIQYKIRYGTLL